MHMRSSLHWLCSLSIHARKSGRTKRLGIFTAADYVWLRLGPERGLVEAAACHHGPVQKRLAQPPVGTRPRARRVHGSRARRGQRALSHPKTQRSCDRYQYR